MAKRMVTFGELVDNKVLEIGAGRPRTAGLHLPVLRVADVLDGRIQSTAEAGEFTGNLEVLGPKTSRPGDIVLTTKGSVGRVAIMPEGGPTFAYSPQLCFFRPVNEGPLELRYLYYWFKSAEFWVQADAVKAQTDMADFISLQDILALRIQLPTVREQQAIAEVLGALDDKIVANSNVVRNLLDLADAEFRMATKGVNPGPLSFGEVADVGGGGTPRTSMEEYWGGEVAWATPTDVTALAAPYLMRTARTITDEGLAACSSVLYPVGSILMTSRATIGAFAIAEVPTAVNQGFIVVNAKEARNQLWLFHEMKSRVPEFLTFANGATFLELPRGRFKGLPVRLADDERMVRFGERVAPIHSAASAFTRETEKLARTRDELLPLLMSGKVRVQDVAKSVEGVL